MVYVLTVLYIAYINDNCIRFYPSFYDICLFIMFIKLHILSLNLIYTKFRNIYR